MWWRWPVLTRDSSGFDPITAAKCLYIAEDLAGIPPNAMPRATEQNVPMISLSSQNSSWCVTCFSNASALFALEREVTFSWYHIESG